MIPRAAVVGSPVKHSLSPLIFREFARASGRPVRYTAVALPPRRLADAVKRAPARGWTGWNVTLPHKVAIMDYLDWIDDSAREAGAVNVVHFHGGRAVGHNTDGPAFLESLRREGVAPAGAKVLVLGAGGAARAVCAVLRRAGADVAVHNRTPARAAELAKRFGLRAARDLKKELAAADLVVNATSAGLDGKSSPLPKGAKLKKGAVAYDLIYRPTPFLKEAARQKARAIDGLAMLVLQAAASWRVWFRDELPAAAVEKALAKARKAAGR